MRAPDRPAPVSHVLVVVPARDEEELLGRCLRGVERATALLRRQHPRIACRTVVVLDGCTDSSAAVAAAYPCDVVAVDVAAVGAARAVGIAHARGGWSSVDPRRVLVATTDADSEVPPDWLSRQMTALDAGADLVLGGVRPDPTSLTPSLLRAWHRADAALDRGQRVHGANLAVRLSAYDRAGGFALVREHEDVALVAVLRTQGAREAIGPTVLTSARSTGRTPGGFAGYLRALAGRGDSPVGISP